MDVEQIHRPLGFGGQGAEFRVLNSACVGTRVDIEQFSVF